MKELLKRDFENDINIYPIFDAHYGSLQHHEREFRDYLKLIKDDPVGYVVLGGDLISNNIGKMNPYDDVISPHLQKRDMAEMLEPIRDRILCSVRGNHELRTVKYAYQDASRDIMAKLDLEELYRPDIAFVSIGIGTRTHGKRASAAAARFVIGVCHGFGGGIKSGSTINRAEDFWTAFEGVNVGITGHTHNPIMKTKRKQVIDRVNGVVTIRDDLVVIASSWQDGSEGYAVQKGLVAQSSCIVQKIALHAPHKVDGQGTIEPSFRPIGGAKWEDAH